MSSTTSRLLSFARKLPSELRRAVVRYGQCCDVQTVVEGGVLVDPETSTRRRRGVHEATSARVSGQVHNMSTSMDETFEVAVEGAIMTKTTITVTREPQTPTRPMANTPSTCRHSFRMIKSDTSLLLWNCGMCASGPHWAIFECSVCKLKACRLCTYKT